MDVSIVDPGTVAYIPPIFTALSMSGEQISLNFGPVHNVDSSSTQVVLDVAFGIRSDVAAGTNIDLSTVTQTVGGVNVGTNFQVTVLANVRAT